jgi:RimJ/RimL family protein N-acetyltransferase
MEKGGMQQEGLLRSHRVDRSGARVDEVLYGITREDWERVMRRRHRPLR